MKIVKYRSDQPCHQQEIYRGYTVRTYVDNEFHMWRVLDKTGFMWFQNSRTNGAGLPLDYGIKNCRAHVDSMIATQKARLRGAIRIIEEEHREKNGRLVK